ncbi:LysR substrate-binding domain-containing protein, partial [Vibrio sp.]|nr:LysR substrate-binding domain-containing protein [Vibrio sp.]
LHRGLIDRTLDMAFAFDPIKVDELESKKVADIMLTLVSTEHFDDASDVFSHQYVYVDWGSRFSSEHNERHPDMKAPFLRTSTARIALDYILEKGGSAYIPQSMATPFVDSKQLHVVSNVERWRWPIYLSYRKNSSSLEAITQVKELVRSIDPLTGYTVQQAGEMSS